MKIKNVGGLIFTIGLCFQLLPANAQVVVKIRPEPPKAVVVRPAMPGPGMMWIEPDWYWSKNKKAYVWREGRWVHPRKRAVWVPGHWQAVPGGHNWSPGYWGRRK